MPETRIPRSTALLLAGILAGAVASGCTASAASTAPSASTSLQPSTPPAASVSASLEASPSASPSATPTPEPSATPTPEPSAESSASSAASSAASSITWTKLSVGYIPAVEPNTDGYSPNGILHGWRNGYVEFVWHPSEFKLVPWTSTDSLTWTQGSAIDAGAIWKSELKTFSDANKDIQPLSCSFADTGWAEGGVALIMRGRLSCAIGCGSYWYSTETMLVSPDGKNWAAIDERKKFGAGGIGRISGGGSGLAALGLVGGEQVDWISTNGTDWTRRAIPADLAGKGSWAVDPASMSGVIVQAGVHMEDKTGPATKRRDYMPGPGIVSCNATTGDVSPPYYAPEVFTSPNGANWSAAVLPGAVKAMDVSVDVVRFDDSALIVTESYALDASGDWKTIFWYSRDGLTWTKGQGDWNVYQSEVVEAHAGGMALVFRDSSGYDLSTLGDQGNLVLLTQLGDVPALSSPQLAIGPAGVLATQDGTAIWLGRR